MRLRVETVVGVGSLLALQLLTSFAAIGLLARTSPAAELILREDITLSAVEEMLGVLASDGEGETFERALQAAKREGRTERERDLVHRIELRADSALVGDPAARLDIVVLARELSALNRATMQDLDREARFLGRAGAWASALLGGFGFLLSVLVYRRLRHRLEQPVVALDGVLQSVRRGDLRQRASARDVPVELRRIAENLNYLIDRHEEETRRPVRVEERADRTLLIAVLDRFPDPVVVIDANGQALASNAAALALLDDPGAPCRKVAEAVRSHMPPEGWIVEEIPKANAFLCRRLPSPA